MTLIKKCDVKMHFSVRLAKRLHLVQQADKLAAAVFPVADIAIESKESGFIEDFSLEHSSPGGTMSAVVLVANSGDAQVPEMHSTPRS
jgi:hypothetical protein